MEAIIRKLISLIRLLDSFGSTKVYSESAFLKHEEKGSLPSFAVSIYGRTAFVADEVYP